MTEEEKLRRGAILQKKWRELQAKKVTMSPEELAAWKASIEDEAIDLCAAPLEEQDAEDFEDS